MSHRSGGRYPRPETVDLDDDGESLAELAQQRRDSRSYTIDYTGMGQQMIPTPTSLVQNTQKQSKKYLNELKGSSKDSHKKRKLLRSLSVPFLNSWDFNSIDITSQMHIPGVGNLKTYLKKRWNRSSTRPVRPGRFKADPRRIHELSSESPEETAMFREKRRSSMKEKTLDLLMEEKEDGVSRVAAGTPVILVQCLLDVENTDDSYAHTVFLTHDAWMSSADMLTILSEIYFGRRTKDWLSKTQLEDAEFFRVLKKRIIKLMTLWITDYFLDFRDNPDLTRQFKEFLYELGGAGKEEKRMADILLDTFMASVAESTPPATPTDGATGTQTMTKRRSGKHIFVRERSPRKLNFLDVDPKSLARQFCIFDQRMIARVRYQELVSGNWNKGKGENIVALRDRSNFITQWVATEILQTPNSKQRIVVLGNFLELCISLLELRNFGTCFNIYHGLRMPQVARLTKTWNGLDPKTLSVWQDLEAQLRGLSTFFEQALAAPSPKILPISLLLRFLEVREQEPDTHRRYLHMINFNKMRSVADLVKPFTESQSVQYGFEENPMILVYLERYLSVIDSQHKLTKLSRDIEGDSHNPSSGASVVMSPRSKSVRMNTSSKSAKGSSHTVSSSKSDAAVKKSSSEAEIEKPLIAHNPLSGKTREQINTEIHNELISKWKRPLTKCSVGSDLPRLISKILVADARGHTLYKCREDRKKIYLAREMNMFLRCISQQLESTKDAKSIEKSFRDYFTIEERSEASTDIIKETGRFVQDVLGEDSIVTSLLKVTASQGIISPAWVRLKLFILAGLPFKDARKGWRIYIIFEPFFVTICHIKKEMSSDQTTGSRHFEFTWELKMVFDRKLEQMIECSLVISDINISDDMPSDKQLQLAELVKPWQGPSFRAVIQYGLEGESEESSVIPEEILARKNASNSGQHISKPHKQVTSPTNASRKSQSEKKIVVESVSIGAPSPKRAKSDAKLSTKKALISTPVEDDGNDSDKSSPSARIKRRKSSRDKLESKSDKEDGYNSSNSLHRRSGSKEKVMAKSKSRETLMDGYDSTSGRRTSSGDKNKILLTGGSATGSPLSGSPVTHGSYISSSKRSGSLTLNDSAKIVHTPGSASPTAPASISSASSPRRPAQNAISKASELLHDESESVDDAAIAHLRRLAPPRGRSTSVGRQSQPALSSSARASALTATTTPAVASPPPSVQSPSTNKRALTFNDAIVADDGVTSPLRQEGAMHPSSSGMIAGSGSDESSSASAGGGSSKRISTSHDRLNTSVRKSLELKNLDVVRAFTDEAEKQEHQSYNKKSARKSMPARSKTPRAASARDAKPSVGSSSGILSDPENSPPSSSRLSVAAASVHLSSAISKSSSKYSGSSSARAGTSKTLKEKERERESGRASSRGSSHRSSHSTPRDTNDSARDRQDREAERERERQKERERDALERASSREKLVASPRSIDGVSSRSSPKGSPREKTSSTHSSPDSDNNGSHVSRRGRASSRSSRDIKVMDVAPSAVPVTSPTAHASAEDGGESSAKRRPRAPSLSDDRPTQAKSAPKLIPSTSNTSLASMAESSPRRDSEDSGRSSALPVPPPPVPITTLVSPRSAPNIASPRIGGERPSDLYATDMPTKRPSAIALAAAETFAVVKAPLAEWDVTDSSVSEDDDEPNPFT